MAKAIKYFLRHVLEKLGWQDCPECNSFIKPKWVQDWIYDPEEPPMFYHYECRRCGARTDTIPSPLTEKSVKRLGFKDFHDYYKRVILRDGD